MSGLSRRSPFLVCAGCTSLVLVVLTAPAALLAQAECDPPVPEGVIPRDVAVTTVLEFLASDPGEGSIDAFVPSCPLLPGDTVGPHLGEAVIQIEEPTWFAFLDDDPHSAFEHPVRYLFIDGVEGTITTIADEFIYPDINGEPRYVTLPDRHDGDRVADGGAAMPEDGGANRAEAPAPAPQPTVWGVVVGGSADPADKSHVDKMRRALRTNPGIPDANLKSKKCATKEEFCRLLEGVRGCDKLYFVLTTHGSNVERDNVQPWRVQFANGWMPVEEVIRKLKATNATKFCIVAETCYSGCFIEKARGKIDAEIYTAASSSKTSVGWSWFDDRNRNGRRDAGEPVTRKIWHYLENFEKCLIDPDKKADKRENGGDGNGTVSLKEAHAWARAILVASGAAEANQDPQSEETFEFDVFLWSGGEGQAGGTGCTKLNLYNPSCTETREIDWEIKLHPSLGLGAADGVGIVDSSGTETLGPKERKSIKIRFQIPATAKAGDVIFPDVTVKIHGTEKVIGTNGGCLTVSAATLPGVEQSSNSSFVEPHAEEPRFGQVRFGVTVPPELLGQPLPFRVRARNVDPEDPVIFPIEVPPPEFQLVFNEPTERQEIPVQVFVPAGTRPGTVNEIFLEFVPNGGGENDGRGQGIVVLEPAIFASLGVIARPSFAAGDCNENGTIDADEIETGAATDCNGNGRPDECDEDCDGNSVPDDCDIAGGAADVDGNGIPDSCEPDCNANTIPDVAEIAAGDARDCNFNRIPDSCDILGGRSVDSNGDGVPDECQDCNADSILDPIAIAGGTDADCNQNGIPDGCELEYADCNENGIPDACDIASGTSTDCDANTYPDECELAGNDCNANGAIDACEIVAGDLTDADENGFPDECEQPPGGAQLPTDLNQDARSDISDAIAMLRYLFFGEFSPLPCGDGTVEDASNRAVLDANGDARFDVSDPIYFLQYQFFGGPAPVLGTECRTLPGCPDVCRE